MEIIKNKWLRKYFQKLNVLEDTFYSSIFFTMSVNAGRVINTPAEKCYAVIKDDGFSIIRPGHSKDVPLDNRLFLILKGAQKDAYKKADTEMREFDVDITKEDVH